MAQQLIGVGSAPNDTTGDPLRTSFIKCNDNFTELYGRASPLGQCRLVYVSSTQIRLNRYDGTKLFINGAYYDIPSAGVTFTYSGQTINTVYNVYAYMSGGTMTLELSTTARTTDATYGHQIKSGDATRTLVGKIATGNSGTFQVSADTCYVISWFNRKSIRLVKFLAADFATSTAPYVDTGAYIFLLTWGEDAVHCGAITSFAATTAGSGFLQPKNDEATFVGAAFTYSFSSTNVESLTVAGNYLPAEGLRYMSPWVGSGAGTITFYATGYTAVWAVIWG